MQTNSVGSSSSTSAVGTKSLGDIDLDDFLKMMITELQNQDPLNPMENAQILQQMSQIREIEATDQLSKTLNAVLLGQNLVSASSMIGREIDGLSAAGVEVHGIVERVSVEDGTPRLFVGDQAVPLKYIRAIRPVADASEGNSQLDMLQWLAALSGAGSGSAGT